MQANNQTTNMLNTKTFSGETKYLTKDAKESKADNNQADDNYSMKFSDMFSFVLSHYKDLLRNIKITENTNSILYEILLIQCKHEKKYYFSNGSDFHLNNVVSDIINTISNQDVENIYKNINFINYVSNHVSMGNFLFKSMRSIVCLSKSIENECFSSIVKFIYCSYMTIKFLKENTIEEIKSMIIKFETEEKSMLDIEDLTIDERSIDLYLNSLRMDFYELYELIGLEGFLRYGGIIDFTNKIELENKVTLIHFYNVNKSEFKLNGLFPAVTSYIENSCNIDVDFEITQEQFEIQKKVEVDMMLFEHVRNKVGHLCYFLNSFMND